MDTFDVALWREWPPFALPVVEIVEAEDQIQAIEKVMYAHDLVRVFRVSVTQEGYSFVSRYRHVMMIDGALEGETVIDSVA